MPAKETAAVTQAVLAICKGEASHGSRKGGECDILLDHEIFSAGIVSPVSSLIGFPLKLLQDQPSRKYDLVRSMLVHEDTPDYNHTAATLMCECDDPLPLVDDAAQMAPSKWSDEAGSVLIVRADGAPLYEQHVKLILRFIEEALQGTETSLIRRRVDSEPKDLFEPGYFKEFCMDLKRKTIAETEDPDAIDYLKVPMPFDKELQSLTVSPRKNIEDDLPAGASPGRGRHSRKSSDWGVLVYGGDRGFRKDYKR